jgi:cell division protein FtsL
MHLSSVDQKIASQKRRACSEETAMTSPASVYRIFRRPGGEAHPVRSIVIAMVVVASLVAGVGIVSVQRQREILQLGLQVSRASDRVEKLRETRRRLELERATLTAPDRLRRLATQLGMAEVAPDRIRIVKPRQVTAAGPRWDTPR